MCSADVAGTAVFEAIGFTVLAFTGGRVGGLLRPPAETGFLLLGADEEDNTAAAGRRDVVNGRFGGAAALLVGFARVSSVSSAFASSAEGRAASSPDSISGNFSDKEASTDALGTVEAMDGRVFEHKCLTRT